MARILERAGPGQTVVPRQFRQERVLARIQGEAQAARSGLPSCLPSGLLGSVAVIISITNRPCWAKNQLASEVTSGGRSDVSERSEA